jgi:hypothetical protein
VLGRETTKKKRRRGGSFEEGLKGVARERDRGGGLSLLSGYHTKNTTL